MIDGERILTDAREISFPRYPGTDGDRRAIGIVGRKLREAGLDVTEEWFSYDIRPAFRAIRLVLIVSGLLVGAAGVVGFGNAVVALVLVALAIGPGLILLAWSPGAEKIYSRPGPTETANVVGRRVASDPRMTLIVMAHHDSKSQNLTFPWRMGMTLAAIAGTLGLIAVLAVSVARDAPAGTPWLPTAFGGSAAVAMLMLSTLRNTEHSPGGVDNGGSVGILCELARRLPADVPTDVELIFLSTGAEEDHMVGAMRWLDAHRDELARRPVWALNFDGAGAPGRTVLIERFGFGRMFSRDLSRVARATAARLEIPVRGIWMLPAMGIDSIPFAHRGVPCLTFSSGSLDRATISVHSANDVADHLDADTLARAATLGFETARDLCRD